MAEAILLVLWLGTLFFFGLREEKKRKDRENREYWLSEVKECIHSIEHEFRWDCEKIAESLFNKSIGEYKYSVKISELEKSYKNDLTEKVVAKKRVHVTTVPNHLVKEYERNISDIADVFRYFGNLYQQKGGT